MVKKLQFKMIPLEEFMIKDKYVTDQCYIVTMLL